MSAETCLDYMNYTRVVKFSEFLGVKTGHVWKGGGYRVPHIANRSE
jgi:hypothetical protein